MRSLNTGANKIPSIYGSLTVDRRSDTALALLGIRYIARQFGGRCTSRAHGTLVALRTPTKTTPAMKMLFALFASLTFAACTPQKSLPGAATEEAQKPSTEMADKNRTIGVIHQATTREGCPWTIHIKEVDYLLDPTNLRDEFMVDGLRVRFDYLPLRMTNRCKEANPIEVLSMVKMK
jgi:hypothetical protein